MTYDLKMTDQINK